MAVSDAILPLAYWRFSPIADARHPEQTEPMGARFLMHMVLGAVVAEVVGLALYLLMSRLLVTGLSSPFGLWWPPTAIALVGGSAGATVSLITRRR